MCTQIRIVDENGRYCWFLVNDHGVLVQMVLIMKTVLIRLKPRKLVWPIWAHVQWPNGILPQPKVFFFLDFFELYELFLFFSSFLVYVSNHFALITPKKSFGKKVWTIWICMDLSIENFQKANIRRKMINLIRLIRLIGAAQTWELGMGMKVVYAQTLLRCWWWWLHLWVSNIWIISVRLSSACHLWYKMWQNHIDFSFGFAFISINLAPLWKSVDAMKRKARWCLI